MGRQSRTRKLRKEVKSDPREASGEAVAAPRLEVPPAMVRLVLGAILLAALLLRLGLLAQYRTGSVFYSQLMLDAQVYDDWAQKIAAGRWLGGEVFYHAPLYPYLLAVAYSLFGHHYLPIYLLQIALGLGQVYLVYRIGREAASEWVGLTAAGLLTFYAALPFFELKIMAVALAMFLCTAALALLMDAWKKGGIIRWVLSGALIGAAALAAPAALLLAPVYAVALLARGTRWVEAGALAAGTLLAIAPATIHNLAAGGGFIPISSQGGITFYQGNSLKSRGLYRTVEGFTGSPLSQQQEERSAAEKATGHPLKDSEVSAYWFGKGLDAIAAQPGAAIGLLQMKLWRWFSSIEYSTEYSQAVERRDLTLLWVLLLPWGVLAVGGVAGMLLGRSVYPGLAPVSLYLAGTILPPLIFYVSSRYRLAAAPALAILCAVTLERLVASVRARGLIHALPIALVLIILTGVTLVPLGRDHLFQEANVRYNAGNLFYDRGDYDTAITLYSQALEVNDFEYYRINLGNALRGKGRLDEAIQQYQLVAQKKPRFAKAYVQWAKVLVMQGKRDEARAIYARAVNLGLRSRELEPALGLSGAGAGTEIAEPASREAP
ncbi:MAG TPA: glycosyltransferase family 39 protein [Candidatus Polarisedimenticolia bacterium]|nr:glycosyltransferase family 39 protein [Candidatus Polarisedimenticolia bacterium]